MDIAAAKRVWAELEGSSQVKFRDELVRLAVRYARLRVDWQLAPPTSRREMDRERTLAHNVLIDACNILSRQMAAAGENNGWRELLGDDRREIGDFACFLHVLLGVAAR